MIAGPESSQTEIVVELAEDLMKAQLQILFSLELPGVANGDRPQSLPLPPRGHRLLGQILRREQRRLPLLQQAHLLVLGDPEEFLKCRPLGSGTHGADQALARLTVFVAVRLDDLHDDIGRVSAADLSHKHGESLTEQ